MRFAAITVMLLLVAAPLAAQTPFVQVYFDPGHSVTTADCPGTQLDTLYVVAHNFNAWLTAIEFSINYPAEMNWLADMPNTEVKIGSSPAGIAMAFPTPLNGFNPVEVMQVMVMWLCSSCGANTNIPLVVAPHPQTGFVRATRYPDNGIITAVGMTSLLCATVPVEQTTWGQIKALYGAN